jgi:hypothetical protein
VCLVPSSRKRCKRASQYPLTPWGIAALAVPFFVFTV